MGRWRAARVDLVGGEWNEESTEIVKRVSVVAVKEESIQDNGQTEFF